MSNCGKVDVMWAQANTYRPSRSGARENRESEQCGAKAKSSLREELHRLGLSVVELYPRGWSGQWNSGERMMSPATTRSDFLYRFDR